MTATKHEKEHDDHGWPLPGATCPPWCNAWLCWVDAKSVRDMAAGGLPSPGDAVTAGG
jgi:hypothetical protein